jgi:hypothetical protein
MFLETMEQGSSQQAEFFVNPRFMAQKRAFLVIAAARNSRLCGQTRFRVAREA